MKQLFTLVCFLLVAQSLRADCWKVLSAGDYFSLGLQSDGSLWIWGKNTGNALFADSNRYEGSSYPVRIGTDAYWRTVSAGQDHILGIRTDGSLWAWGSNSFGKLGIGTAGGLPVNAPRRIGSDTDWVAVSAGDNHSVALKSDGSLWAWGFNFQGALGDSSRVDKYVPTRIGTGNSWQMISAGRDYTMAIKANGSLWGWGYNNGRLGDGQSANTIVPVQIGLDSNWRMVDAASIHTMAIKTDSSLWATGGTGGVLGNGMSFSRSMVPVDSGHHWLSVTLGASYTMALRANGTLWGWGTTYSATPAQIGTATNWSMISARNKHTLEMAADNSVWAFGWNIEGQVGDSSTMDRSLPVFVSKCAVANLAIPAATTKESFAIYPNPVHDVLKVLHPSSAPISRMELMDLSGRSVAAPELNSESVSTQHLAPGMYLVKIYSGAGHFSYKFVKE